MTVSFKNTFRDRLAFAAYHYPRNRAILIFILGFYLLFTFMSVIPAMHQVNVSGSQVARVIAFIFMEIVLACIVLAFWSLMILLTMLISMSSRNKTFFLQKNSDGWR